MCFFSPSRPIHPQVLAGGPADPARDRFPAEARSHHYAPALLDHDADVNAAAVSDAGVEAGNTGAGSGGDNSGALAAAGAGVASTIPLAGKPSARVELGHPQLQVPEPTSTAGMGQPSQPGIGGAIGGASDGPSVGISGMQLEAAAASSVSDQAVAAAGGGSVQPPRLPPLAAPSTRGLGLEPGDILLSLNGAAISHFIPLEEAVDNTWSIAAAYQHLAAQLGASAAVAACVEAAVELEQEVAVADEVEDEARVGAETGPEAEDDAATAAVGATTHPKPASEGGVATGFSSHLHKPPSSLSYHPAFGRNLAPDAGEEDGYWQQEVTQRRSGTGAAVSGAPAGLGQGAGPVGVAGSSSSRWPSKAANAQQHDLTACGLRGRRLDSLWLERAWALLLSKVSGGASTAATASFAMGSVALRGMHL